MTKNALDHFQQKDNDELISIAFSTTDDWQQKAIDKSKEILQQRKISREKQSQRWREMEDDMREIDRLENERRKTEDYTLSEKVLMLISWPRELLWDWGLKKEGYELKSKRRLQLIGAGILLTVLPIAYALSEVKENEQKRIEEIESIDITEWEENYYGVDSLGNILRPREKTRR